MNIWVPRLILFSVISLIFIYAIMPDFPFREWIPIAVALFGILSIGVLLLNWMDSRQAEWEAWAEREAERNRLVIDKQQVPPAKVS